MTVCIAVNNAMFACRLGTKILKYWRRMESFIRKMTMPQMIEEMLSH